MRLRTRFVVALVAVAMVLSVTTLVGFTLYRDAVVTQERSDLARTSETVATQMDLVLGEKRETVRLWSQNGPMPDHGSTAQHAELRVFVRSTSFSGASVIARNGTMTAIHSRGLTSAEERGLEGQLFEDRKYFQRAVSGETYVSDPVDAASGFLIVTVSAPVYERGRIVATFNAAFHLREGDFADVARASSTRTHGVHVDSDGQPVFASGPSPAAAETELVSNATVPSTGWTVSATSTRGAFESRLWTITLLQAGAFGLVLLSLAGFGGWLYREYVGNVERLQRGFDSLVAREYGTRVALSGASEWDRVGDQFNDLSETLAQRRTEVTVLNRVLRHNLRNAMTVVVGNADRIESRTDDGATAADAERIRQRGESLLDLADHARAVESSLESRPDETSARPVTAILEEVATVLTDEYPNALVTVDASDAADSHVPSGDLLVVVFDELARNGVAHNDVDRPEVRLAASADPETVSVSVSDDGPGLPPVERRVLTDPFVETPTQHGSGLGLWLVTWVVSRVGGDVEVATGDGTTVTLTLPRVSADDETDGDEAADVLSTDRSSTDHTSTDDTSAGGTSAGGTSSADTSAGDTSADSASTDGTSTGGGAD